MLSHLGQHNLPSSNYFKKVETPVLDSEGLGPSTQSWGEEDGDSEAGFLPQDVGGHQHM